MVLMIAAFSPLSSAGAVAAPSADAAAAEATTDRLGAEAASDQRWRRLRRPSEVGRAAMLRLLPLPALEEAAAADALRRLLRWGRIGAWRDDCPFDAVGAEEGPARAAATAEEADIITAEAMMRGGMVVSRRRHACAAAGAVMARGWVLGVERIKANAKTKSDWPSTPGSLSVRFDHLDKPTTVTPSA